MNGWVRWGAKFLAACILAGSLIGVAGVIVIDWLAKQ